MSEAKRYDGPVAAGMEMIKVAHYGECVNMPIGSKERITKGNVNTWDCDDYRRAYRPVDAPAEPAPKVERKLAAGWSVAGDEKWDCTTPDGERCTHPFGDERIKHRAAYIKRSALAGACESCAPSMGVLDAPTVAAKPGCKPGCGERHGSRGKGWTPFVYGHVDGDYCSTACAPKFAPAKPAEPAPAPSVKAKREWVRQVEEDAKALGPCAYSAWAALQTGVATGLAREQPAPRAKGGFLSARIGGER